MDLYNGIDLFDLFQNCCVKLAIPVATGEVVKRMDCHPFAIVPLRSVANFAKQVSQGFVK